jgi:hypothetical protein
MTPKMAPVRSASWILGLCRAAPLPTAAAKASVDIASAMKTVERTFIDHFQVGTKTHGMRNQPDLHRASHANGLANLTAACTTVKVELPSMLMQALLVQK